MEAIAREVARLAHQVQRGIEDLQHEWALPAQPTEPADPIAEALDRIDRKLAAVYGHTSDLIERVPKDLGRVLLELKRSLILRLEEVAGANGSAGSSAAAERDQGGDSAQSPMAAMKSLTPQEQRVFQLCFQSGFLSYREIAEQLDITPSAAKNLVNRIFQSDRKRPLFAKQYKHGTARVGIQPELEERVLAGNGNRESERARTVVSASR